MFSRLDTTSISVSLNVVVRPKTFPPMPESGQSEFNRFKRFARSLLAAPKAEISIAEGPLEA